MSKSLLCMLCLGIWGFQTDVNARAVIVPRPIVIPHTARAVPVRVNQKPVAKSVSKSVVKPKVEPKPVSKTAVKHNPERPLCYKPNVNYVPLMWNVTWCRPYPHMYGTNQVWGVK